jgi:hypothetical protein
MSSALVSVAFPLSVSPQLRNQRKTGRAMEQIRGQRFWSKLEVPFMTTESLQLTAFSNITKNHQGMLKLIRLSVSKVSKEEWGF